MGVRSLYRRIIAEELSALGAPYSALDPKEIEVALRDVFHTLDGLSRADFARNVRTIARQMLGRK